MFNHPTSRRSLLQVAASVAAAAAVALPATAARGLVARLRGSGAKRPLLLVAHMDVVEAKREDWAFDPFKLQETDGFFRARGAVPPEVNFKEMNRLC